MTTFTATTEKQINWSYPSSPNADRLGFPDGCWTVSVSKASRPAVAKAGFVTLEDAIAYAKTLPMPFGMLWTKYNG